VPKVTLIELLFGAWTASANEARRAGNAFAEAREALIAYANDPSGDPPAIQEALDVSSAALARFAQVATRDIRSPRLRRALWRRTAGRKPSLPH
jgi:hypothetical protein